MKTTSDIVAEYKMVEERDWLGFTGEVLLPFLSKEEVKQFLKEDADLSNWKQHPLDRDFVIRQMRAYMEFAWTKVSGHRGISADRSINKMRAWMWLLEDREGCKFADTPANYPQYGAPILAWICKKYGFEIPDTEDIRNMIAGQPCHPGCENGCGR